MGLNDFIFGRGYSLDHHNLCPYFWGTILAIVICIPTIIYRMLENVLSDGIKTTLRKYGFGLSQLVIGIAISVIMSTVSVLIYAGIILLAFNIIMYNTNILDNIFTKIHNRKKSTPKPHVPRKPSMTVAMIKGWKNKHCPMVEWE